MTLYVTDSLEGRVIKFIYYMIKNEQITLKENCQQLLFVHHKTLITAGLCHIVRQSIKSYVEKSKENQKIATLLGYKQNCLKACAAVSCWTNFCEIDFPIAVLEIKKKIQKQDYPIEIGNNFAALEKELLVPKKTPNATKFFTSKNKKIKLSKDSILPNSNFNFFSLVEVLNSLSIEKCLCVGEKIKVNDLTDLTWINKVKSKYDIEWPYLCALNITIADLIVYGMFLEVISELGTCVGVVEEFFSKLPNTLKWFLRCSSQVNIISAACSVWNFNKHNICCQYIEKDKIFNFTHQDDVRHVSYEEKTTNPKQMHLRIEKKLPSIFETLKTQNVYPRFAVTENLIDIHWDRLPPALDPTEGELNPDRALRKRQQIQNMMHHVMTIVKPGDKVIDFCAGGGHLGIVIAYLRNDCHVTLLESKEESIERALGRIKKLGLQNITVYLSNLNYYNEPFDLGVTLHACGSATDLVLKKCMQERASFVVCPCCYGSIRPTDDIEYPKCRKFSVLQRDDYFLLARSADQTSADFESDYSKQGKNSMLFIDYDRAMHVIEQMTSLDGASSYSTNVHSMVPESCSPKNNIIVGKS